MSSQLPGDATSRAGVVDISPHGIWILVQEEEFFLPYDAFPWFRKASVEAVLHMVEETPGHCHWPDLDIDLDVDRMRHPDRYPLAYDADA